MLPLLLALLLLLSAFAPFAPHIFAACQDVAITLFDEDARLYEVAHLRGHGHRCERCVTVNVIRR